MRFETCLFGMAMIMVVTPAFAADLDRDRTARLDRYAAGAPYARLQQPCVEGSRSVPPVLHCPPQIVLPSAAESFDLTASYLEIKRPRTKPYNQVYSW